jgi:hypothetical protein
VSEHAETRSVKAVDRGAVVVQPRVVVGLLLIAAAVVWALIRGLASYGGGVVGLGYDLDQPPLMLALVGVWIIARSRRR